MFRFLVVTGLSLGLLSSCGPEDVGPLASGDSLRQQASALPIMQRSLELSSNFLDLGNQKRGTTGPARGVKVTDINSEYDLAITGLAATGPYSGASRVPFGVTWLLSEDLQVRFSPTALGPAPGVLTVSSSDSYTPQVPIELAGTGVASAADPRPSRLAFGEQGVGGPGASQSLEVHNVGDAPFQVRAELEGAGATSYRIDPSTLTVPVNGSSRFTVTFSPSEEGAAPARLTLTTDEADSPPVPAVLLTGTGVRPMASVSASLDFGPQRIGASAVRPVTVSNAGSGTLTVSNLSLSGSGAGFYSVTPSALAVPAGGSGTLNVTFTPTVPASFPGTLTLATNDAGRPSVAVPLAGAGTPPLELQLSATQVDFGDVQVGSPSAPRTLTLTNTGTHLLTLSALGLSGVDAAAFSLTAPSLPVMMDPGNSVEVTVRVQPDAERPFSGMLRVDSDDPNAPSMAVPLTGQGISQLHVSAALEFGKQLVNNTAMARKVRITNDTGASVTLSALQVEGAVASPFSVKRPTLPLVLAPGEAQEVAVAFTPQAESEVSARLVASFSEPAVRFVVALHGQGLPAVLSFTPPALDFGLVRVGGSRIYLPVTVTNLSSDPVVIARPGEPGYPARHFGIDAESWEGRTLGPGASTELMISYGPGQESHDGSLLGITASPPKQGSQVEVKFLPVVSVALRGQAVTHVLTFKPGSLDFGRVEEGMAAEPQVITLTNTFSEEQRVVVKLREAQGTPFTLERAEEVQPIPPGGSASFQVSFRPQGGGTSQNEVQVWLEGATEPEGVIPVTGTVPGGGCGCGSTEAGGAGMLALLVALGSRRRSGARG
ncbi:MAG: choice-of-anchor D domain-containing protein [Hyalangium sp.]|uniref:choice-of-anchor D domain-containing protein n=1 Tax=Hyalangium sp. TaxID=2028555 RepID=UPI00389AAD04